MGFSLENWTRNFKKCHKIPPFSRKHKNIETILENIDTEKYKVPDDFPYKEARKLFFEPEVTPGDQFELKWTKPDLEGMIEFLCKEKGFNEERVRSGYEKIVKQKKKGNQGRIDTFFKLTVKDEPKKKGKQEKRKAGKKEAPASKKLKKSK